MTCCGSLQDITTQDDKIATFMCSECGKIGHSSDFPDPPEPPEELTRTERITRWITSKF